MNKPILKLSKTKIVELEEEIESNRQRLMECFAREVVRRGATARANPSENWLQVGRRLYGDSFDDVLSSQKAQMRLGDVL